MCGFDEKRRSFVNYSMCGSCEKVKVNKTSEKRCLAI
jgi:hypothetical protein